MKVSVQTVGAARNRGVEKSDGSYLVFLDADVLVEKDFLQKIRAHIEKTHARLLTTRIVPDSSVIIDRVIMYIVTQGLRLFRHAKRPFLLGYDIVISRSVFTALGGFSETLKQSEDWELARCAREKNIILEVVPNATLTVSFRRLSTEGRFEVVRKLLTSLVHMIFTNRINDSLYEYKMGGGHYRRTKP